MTTSETFSQWPLLKGIMALTLVSASLYTFNVALAFSCIRQFLAQKASLRSKLRLAVSCAYVFALIAVASEAAIHLDISLIHNIKALVTSTQGLVVFHVDSITLPIAIWGADGVLMWRCIILYQLCGRRQRILLHIVLGSLGLLSIVCGIIYIIGGIRFPDDPSFLSTNSVISAGVTSHQNPDLLLLLPVTLATNGTLSMLITARLVYAHRILSAAQSDSPPGLSRPGPYLTALAICVESSAIIFIAAVLRFLAFFVDENSPFGWNSSFQPAVLVTQLCVISPLLIIYRVSRGRSNETITRLEETLAFHHTQHSAISQSDIDGA